MKHFNSHFKKQQYLSIYILGSLFVCVFLLLPCATVSAANIDISGTLYAADGTTPLTGTSYTIKAAIGTSTLSLHSTTTNSANGTWRIDGIATSSTATSWASTSAAEANPWNDVAYGEGRFVAVSNSGSSRVMYSDDGITWTNASSSGQHAWQSVTYGNGLFVAVACGLSATVCNSTSASGRVMYSDNGITWTSASLVSIYRPMVVEYGNGMFLAMGNNTYALTSRDGITWEEVYNGISTGGDIPYAEEKFFHLTNPSTQSSNRLLYGPDGQQLTTANPPSANGFHELAYGNGVYVATGQVSSLPYVMYSSTGISGWTQAGSVPHTNLYWHSLTFGNGRFVAISNTASSSPRIMTSKDGNTWTAVTAAANNTWTEVVYGEGKFVAVSSSGTNRVMYSDAGFNTDTPVTLWVDNHGTVDATTFMMGNSGISDSTGIPLRQNTVVAYNASTSATSTITNLRDMIFYDRVDDADILYTATPNGTTTIHADFINQSIQAIAPHTLALKQDFSNEEIIDFDEGIVAFTGTTTQILTGNLDDDSSLFTLRVGTSSTLNIANERLELRGNITNQKDVVATNSTTTFSGLDAQVVTGTLIGSDALAVVSIETDAGTSSATVDVTFNNALETNGVFSIASTSRVAFAAGATSTFANVNWGELGSRMTTYLQSSASGTPWVVEIESAPIEMTYLDIKDADLIGTTRTCTSCVDGGGNSGFVFTPNEWNSTNWSDRVQITINHGYVSGDVTNFPVYVNLAHLPAEFWNSVRSDGGDIRAVSTSLATEYPVDVVTINTGGDTGELHVLLPSVAGATNTTFYLYWNGTTPAVAYDHEFGRNVVWSEYYVVWHMDSLTQYDSAGNLPRRTVTGTFADPTLTGGNVVMDSNDDLITNVALNGKDSTLPMVTSWSAMVYWNDAGSSTAGRYGSSNTTSHFTIQNTNVVTGSSTVRAGAGTNHNIGGVVEGSGNHLLHITYNNGSGLITIYVDGVLDRTLSGLAPTVPWNGWNVYRLIGTHYESRGAPIAFSSDYVLTQYANFASTTDFYDVGVYESTAVGSSTLSNHVAGQAADSFSAANKTNETLFTFKLTPNSGSATTTNMIFTLSGVQKITNSTFSNVRLFRDFDADGQYDAANGQVGGAGSVSISGQSGTITFADDFRATTSQNYILVADWTAPQNGALLTVGVSASNISMTEGNGSYTVYGSVTSAQHLRTNKGGGGSSATVGGDAPAGGGVQSGGGSGGGGGIDTNTGGSTIGSEPGFFWPGAHSGSWTTGENAYDQADGTYATTNAANTHSYNNHGFSVPGSNQITGIAVKLEVSGTTGAGTIDAELSWDGGTSWTTAKTTPTLTTTDTVRTLGSASDLWGRTWSSNDFSNGNFRVRLTGAPSSNTVQVDAIQVRVYHQSTGGGGGGGGEI